MNRKFRVDLESTRQKSTEVEAMLRLHGMSLEDACDLVGLPPRHYRGADFPLEWLPTPSEIEAMLRPLRKEKEKIRRIEIAELTPPLLRGEKA